ncbi:MAG: adenylate/guanylate cyclase domain-containing protein [Bacteroidales bacterium]|jgi:class 3 adenylate cyclase|nr:adenylate/guanylate cyclase domain-containing protein [Bacteroidales bacterium]
MKIIEKNKFDTEKKSFCSENIHFRKWDCVTVMFADIDDFYEYSQQVPPEQLLQELHAFFSRFDETVERFHLEKIKTIGDAYMCAAGIFSSGSHHPVNLVAAALDIKHHFELPRQCSTGWSVRFGIHTGAVYSGILGRKQPMFDIWGPTVNLASRLESSCPKGEIQISDITYELVKEHFICEYRGPMPEKWGKGSLYIVKEKK